MYCDEKIDGEDEYRGGLKQLTTRAAEKASQVQHQIKRFIKYNNQFTEHEIYAFNTLETYFKLCEVLLALLETVNKIELASVSITIGEIQQKKNNYA